MEQMSPDVVAALVEHHQRFRDFLERRVISRAEAEELLQAAFVKGIERGGELRDGESAVAWFYHLLRNAVVDFYRHRAAQQWALDRHGRETAVTTELDRELHDAVCQCVHGLIPTLKPEYADVLRAVEMNGEAVATVAGRLGITPGNASVRLHRARHALKQRLEAACGTCTEHGCLDCTCKGTAEITQS
jgi:RNA polymerase sigma-70 factor (ECF subfamily)